MTRTLPPRPDFTQLRHQAKDLLRAHERKDSACCPVLRRLRRFASADDAAILARPLALHEAQYALAMEYGFASWTAMKQHVLDAGGGESVPRVRRENGRVWIDGVPELRWGRSGECTFAGALSAALSATDRPVAYSDLMGASGLAFRVRWWRRFDQPDWCPSSPVGEFSEEIVAVADAIGWRIRQASRMEDDNKDMSANAQAVRDSIDAGRPVVGYPDADLNTAVCYGYEQSGEETAFLWNAYGRNGHRVSPSKVGPWLLFMDEPIEPMSPRVALKQALTTPNWRRSRLQHWNPVYGDNGWYLYGRDALQQWRKDIAMAESLSVEQQAKLFFVSWWCFDCLIDARRSAAKFLGDHLATIPGEARKHLAKAVGSYSQLAGLAARESFDLKSSFLGPWTGKKLEDWTTEVRAREQEVLSQIEFLDSVAVSEIDEVLLAVGDAQ